MTTEIKEPSEVVSVTAGHGIDNSPYKIFTDKATMESLFSLHFVRLTEQNSKLLRTNEKILCFELDNGSIELRAKTSDMEQIVGGAELAAPIFLFLLYKLSTEKQVSFRFEINEYLDFIGKKRSSSAWEALEKGLRFLSHCDFKFETYVNGRKLQGRGKMGYSIEKLLSPQYGKETDRKSIQVFVPWGQPVIENSKENNQFILLARKIPKLKQGKAMLLATKLAERYRNNLRKRKGTWETLSVEHLIKTIYCDDQKKIAKRKGRYIEQLRNDLEVIQEQNIFEVTFSRRNHQTANDYYQDKIIFRPCSERPEEQR